MNYVFVTNKLLEHTVATKNATEWIPSCSCKSKKLEIDFLNFFVLFLFYYLLNKQFFNINFNLSQLETYILIQIKRGGLWLHSGTGSMFFQGTE